MEKTKVLCLIMAMILATAGTAGVVVGFGGESEPPVIIENSVNQVLDKPDEGLPTDRSAIENLYIAQGELQRKGSFAGTTYGFTTSAGIKQEVINNRVVVNGNVFKEMITIGIVKNAYQLFMYDGNYLYRKFDNIKSANNIKWASTASKYAEKDFLQIFGHRSNSLTGYILNDETIVSGELEKAENGLFQYRYVLDNVKATGPMLLEMKTNSNMNGYSTFEKAQIVVVMDADWQVKTVTTDCKYKVPMLGGVDCVEDITETFSDVEGGDLPEKDFFEKFFDAETENPAEKDPDALSILMDIFSPYIGADKKLNASIEASNNGQSVLSGLVSAKIDIENLENIEVAAKIGSDLYVEYQQGKVYVTYQDFKASTTVDGIMGVVNALVPQTGDTTQPDGEETGGDGILSKFTYSIENGLCTVSLPLEIGENRIELNVYANVVENGYQFVNANVTFGDLEVNVELTEEFAVPEHQGDYPEILGLLDIVQNGVIYGSVNAFGMDVDVMFDLASVSLYATGADLSVIYKNNTVYAEYGAIKAKLAVSDIERIINLLRLAGVIDANSIELPQFSAEQIIELLGSVTASATEQGVKFALGMDGLSAELFLIAAENGWNVDRITVAFGGNVITVAASAPTSEEIPEVTDGDYADVMELLTEFINPVTSVITAASYGADFCFDVTIDNQTYNVAGKFILDANKNVSVNAVVSNGSAKLIKANVVVADNVVYLDVNGLKAAFAVGETVSDVDLSQAVDAIKGVNGDIDNIIDAVYGIVGSVKNFDLATLDFANIVKQFAYADGELSVTVNADFIGLGDIGIKLSVDKRNKLVIAADGINVGGVGIDAEATLLTNVGNVGAPDTDDYVLNLKGNAEDVEFAVTADLFNMDISANVNVFNQTVLVRYIDGKVYASVGNVALVASVDKLGALVSEIMSVIGVEASSLDLSDLVNADMSLQTILNAISVDASSGALNLKLTVDNLADVSVDFDNNADFVGITADIKGYTAQILPSDQRVPQLDTGSVYIPVELLADQVLAIYESFKNVAATGISANIDTTIAINGAEYMLNAAVKYNGGLYLNAKLADKDNLLVSLDMYLVDNAIYLDVNGVRIAAELPANQTAANGSLDVEAVIGALAQAKGYNDVLDSVIAVIEQLPDKLQGVDYLSLLTSLTYSNNVLSASINGKLLGLSDFDVTLSGTSDVTATISGLEIGQVRINGLTVNAIPVCGQVLAPTSEYVTELELSVMGYKVTAKLDLLNKEIIAKTTLLGHELGLYYTDNTVYVSFGAIKAKLNVSDVGELIDVISSFIDGGIPSIEMPAVDVHDVLNSLSKVTTDDGYELNVSVAGINVTLSFDGNAKLTDANVNVKDIDVTASVINGAEYPVFNLNDDYVDLLELVNNFAVDVRNVINADGYDVTLNGNFAFDGNVYNVQANVIYNGGLYVNANVAYNTANIANVELWYVGGRLYVSMGTLKLAVDVPQTAPTQNGGSAIDLTAYKGYNVYVDGILDVVQAIIDKFNAGSIDYVALVDGLTFADGELTLNVNGEQLGVALQSVKLSANNGLSLEVNGLTVGTMTATFNANVKSSDTAVAAPKGDFTTNLMIKIDSNNTLYANIDIINGVYNFRLNGSDDTSDMDDLFIIYADSVIKVYKRGADGSDIYVSGNINQIIDYVKQIDELVNEFSGAAESAMSGINLDMFKNVDLKAIVNSLGLQSDGANATLSASAFGFNLSAIFNQGKLIKVVLPVSMIDKTLEIEPCSLQTFDKFGGEHDYIQIEQVFNDYFPAFERLVHTNSWEFHFDEDTTLTMSGTTYKISQGSYLEFYYKNTEGMDTFKLRAKLDIRKLKGIANGQESWQQFMSVDIAYKDGSIYVTDTGRLAEGKKESDRNTIKLTVSVDTIKKCFGLYDDLVNVVPQIGELVQKISDAMKEAESNAEKLSYASILAGVSYDNGVFGLVLNGGSLLSKLGAVTLSAGTYVNGTTVEGLYLHNLSFAYDGIELNLKGLRVVASDVAADYTEQNKNDAKWYGGEQYKAVQDIAAYDTSNHMDFNSLYELLSSFVITATPKQGDNGARSFYIDGTASVTLALGSWELADIPIGLSVKVDIDSDNNVYIAARIHRTEPDGTLLKMANLFGVKVYNDKGGDSYLYYDGVNETFTVLRNSIQSHNYCSICNNYDNCSKKTLHTAWRSDKKIIDTEFYGHPSYSHVNLTTEQFTAGIIDYIMAMFNFGSMIEDPIIEAINTPNNNDFGIEDILTDYNYSAADCKYAISADLTYISDQLGTLNVDILHKPAGSVDPVTNEKDEYSLTNLNVNIDMLGGMCKANVPLQLKPSVCGQTTQIVTNLNHTTQLWLD